MSLPYYNNKRANVVMNEVVNNYKDDITLSLEDILLIQEFNFFNLLNSYSKKELIVLWLGIINTKIEIIKKNHCI